MVVEKTIGIFASRSRDVSFIPSNHYITICYSFSLFRHNTVLNPNLMDVNIAHDSIYYTCLGINLNLLSIIFAEELIDC